jgi:hypothetical protein
MQHLQFRKYRKIPRRARAYRRQPWTRSAGIGSVPSGMSDAAALAVVAGVLIGVPMLFSYIGSR